MSEGLGLEVGAGTVGLEVGTGAVGLEVGTGIVGWLVGPGEGLVVGLAVLGVRG